MGIAFKDLKPGTYYKGYNEKAPRGVKCFMYITVVQTYCAPRSPTSGPSGIYFRAAQVVRKKGGARWQQVHGTGSYETLDFDGQPDDSSLCKDEVTGVDVNNEGLPLCPLDPAVQNCAAKAANLGAGQFVQPNQQSISPAAMAAKAAAGTVHFKAHPNPTNVQKYHQNTTNFGVKVIKSQNEGKIVIPENASSPTCKKCGQKNKEVPMFRFISYYCPSCEPT